MRNLKSIEKSKELLKKYISTFVREVEVLLHNPQYSIFKVWFKYSSSTHFPNKSVQIKKELKNEDIERETFIILDKTNSNNIKSYKTTNLLSIDKGSVIKILEREFGKKNKVLKFNLSEIHLMVKEGFLIEYPFIKLEVY